MVLVVRAGADRAEAARQRGVARAASGRAAVPRAFRSGIQQDFGVSYLDGGRNQLTIRDMITSENLGMKRVTMTLDPIDVDLLDRLAALEGRNRSEELRSILIEVRPMLAATVEAFEAALRQRDAFDEKAREAAVSGLLAVLPEVEALSRQYMGAMSRLEGGAAAAAALDGDGQAPGSNTGATLD